MITCWSLSSVLVLSIMNWGTRSVWRAEREAAADQRPVEYGYPYRRSICLKASAPTAGS